MTERAMYDPVPKLRCILCGDIYPSADRHDCESPIVDCRYCGQRHGTRYYCDATESALAAAERTVREQREALTIIARIHSNPAKVARDALAALAPDTEEGTE